MRKLLCSLLFVVFSVNTSNSQQSAVLELKDGYLQVGIGQPVHLIHPPPYPPQWVNLDDVVRVWRTITVRKGEKNPCDQRSLIPCSTKLSFISISDPKYGWDIDGEFRIGNDGLAIAHSIPIDRENIPLGAGKFVYTVKKDGKDIFSHEVFVEIR